MSTSSATFVPASAAARMSIRVAAGIAQAAASTKVPWTRLFDAASLDPGLLARPEGTVSRVNVYRLCEAAVALTEQPALGLRCAERISLSTFNPLSLLLAHASTVRQCMESLCAFHRVLGEGATFELRQEDDLVVLRHVGLEANSSTAQRFWSELCMTGVLHVVRTMRPEAVVASVRFAHSPPDYQHEYRQIFGVHVSFNQPFTEIAFSRSLLDAPSPTHDLDVYLAVRAIVERRMQEEAARAPFSQRVRENLVRRGPSGIKDMNSVARSLGLSARSLRRRLASEGKPYHLVANEALACLANQCLSERGLTIQETAYEMGFVDATSFHRAFKRWTGATPSSAQVAPSVISGSA